MAAAGAYWQYTELSKLVSMLVSKGGYRCLISLPSQNSQSIVRGFDSADALAVSPIPLWELVRCELHLFIEHQFRKGMSEQ